MKKLIEFGRKAMFYIRVLSGYEERKIRSYRLQLQQRLQQAEERKAAVRKIPEQMILSEVRRMVEEMQALNKKLEDTFELPVGEKKMSSDRLQTEVDWQFMNIQSPSCYLPAKLSGADVTYLPGSSPVQLEGSEWG
uniref:Uncharacterized protein n=1 Tax=Solanum lycopersicum TaxID=4081 RepID=A0A3Q7HRX6_SOLLC